MVTLPKIERSGVKSAGFVGVMVMLQGWVVVAIALAYIGFLFLVASYGDNDPPLQHDHNPNKTGAFDPTALDFGQGHHVCGCKSMRCGAVI